MLTKQMSMEKILALLSRLNEQELINAREAQRWLTEIGVMFDYLRQDEDLCAILRDDKTQEEEKQGKYRKVQNRYKITELKKRQDLAKVDVFKKMLDDNVEQFFSIFMNQLGDVENGESDFDYDTTGNETDAPAHLTMDELMEMVRRKLRPDYDEQALKACMCRVYAPRFERLGGKIRPMSEVVDNLFDVLNKSTLPTLDGIGDMVKDSLNMLCMAEGLTLTDKRRYLNDLLLKYEVFLKKLSYIIHGKEVENRDPEKMATLADAIFSIGSIRRLKHQEDEVHQQFYQELSFVRDLRNSEAHAAAIATEQEVDAAVGIVIDMYLYAVGTNITEMEMAEPSSYVLPDEETDGAFYISPSAPAEQPSMAAEPCVSDLPEEKRIEILHRSILALQGYDPEHSVFCKQRHWESLFRIAADYGFVIDGEPGYSQFKRFVDRMQLRYMPGHLTENLLSRLNAGIYAKDFCEWTSVGLDGRKLSEYEDLRKVCEAFKGIVDRNINN